MTYAQIIVSQNGYVRCIRNVQKEGRLNSEFRIYCRRYPQHDVIILYDNFLNPEEKAKYDKYFNRYSKTKDYDEQMALGYLEWWAKMPLYRAERMSMKHLNKPALFLSKKEIINIFNKEHNNDTTISRSTSV